LENGADSSTSHGTLRALAFLCVLSAAALSSLQFVDGAHTPRHGAPLDDTFIYYQYARNLADGLPFRYCRDDPPSTGCTSLLWPLMLAAPLKAGLGPEELPRIGVYLCVALLSLCVALWFDLTVALLGFGAALVGVMLLLCNGPLLFAGLGGMEIALFLALLVGGVRSLCLRGHPAISGAWLVLLGFTRPEGALLAALVGVWLALRVLRRGQGRSALVPLVLCLPVIAWAAVHLALTGDPVPATAIAKSFAYRPSATPPGLLRAAFGNLVQILSGLFIEGRPRTGFALGGAWLVLIALGLASRSLRGRVPGRGCTGRVASLAAVLLLTLWSHDWVTAHYYRYVVPVFPLLMLLAIGGLEQLWRTTVFKGAAALLAFLLVAFSVADRAFAKAFYRDCVSDIRVQQEAVGEFLAAGVPTDACVAVNDAGAIAFRSQRRIHDLVGLVTPGQARRGAQGPGVVFESLESLKEKDRPQYFAVHPGWFRYEQLFGEKLFVATVPQLRLTAEKELHVYAVDASVYGSGREPRWRSVRGLPGDLHLIIVDALDVADLDAETAHGYANPRPDLDARALPRRFSQYLAVSDGGVKVADGGRRVVDEERFAFRGAGGLPGQRWLVARLSSPSPARIEWEVQGRLQSIELNGGSGFEEVAIELSGESEEDVLVRCRPAAGAEYFSFHWWLVGRASKK